MNTNCNSFGYDDDDDDLLDVMLIVCCMLCITVTVWSDCDQTFDSEDRKSGVFASPDYPNPYPANKECRYSFEGHEKERVQIAFIDFDLSQNTGDSSDFGPHRE
jgi:CUB domain